MHMFTFSDFTLRSNHISYVNDYIIAFFEPKGKRNRENKSDLNEGIILCLLNTM